MGAVQRYGLLTAEVQRSGLLTSFKLTLNLKFWITPTNQTYGWLAVQRYGLLTAVDQRYGLLSTKSSSLRTQLKLVFWVYFNFSKIKSKFHGALSSQ